MSINSNHPKQQFAFFITSELDERAVVDLKHLIKTISLEREWVLGPPEFFDEVDEPENPEIDDEIRTVGGILNIYSAMPPWRLPKEIDEKHFLEVKLIIDSLLLFSNINKCEIEFEIDGVHVGTIQNGIANNLITKGLLDEWKNGIGNGI